MESSGNLWSSIEILKKTLWNFEFKNPWNPMEIYGVPLKSYRNLVEILGILWEPKEIQWIFMEVQKSENN